MSIKPITENTLFYGDNLDILRQYIPDESVDLVYLDPPFNSNRNYNVLFKDEKGTESQAQITAFEDTWRWDTVAEHTYNDLRTDAYDHIGKMIEALHGFLGTNRMMAYLVMMTARLVELHRVLKFTGSLYLHCDPTASHYLKIILDTIFDVRNFRNEVIWKRSHGHNSARGYGANHDTILFYVKTSGYTWNKVYLDYEPDYIETNYSHIDQQGRRYKHENITGAGISKGVTGKPWHGIDPTSKGRHWARPPAELDKLDAQGLIYWPMKDGGMPCYKRYLDEMSGMVVQSVIADIPPLTAQAKERLGYPTQKPLALLERIISASSNPGDIILDPFCGCGTAIAAAQKLDRQWIGIDITHLAIALQKYRLEAMYPNIKFKVIGEPIDISAARQLASENRYQFQWWALSLIRAKPLGGQQGSREGKKGGDKGIDGVIAFIDDSTQKAKRVLVQVKSGHASSRDIRDLVGTLQRENAAIGVFITLEEPTRDMKTEAVSAGYYFSPGWHKDYPRIQILTIDELLHGASVQMPQQFGTFKEAQKVQRIEEVEQTRFA